MSILRTCAVSGNRRPSVTINGHHWSSMIIRGHHHGLGKMRNESATVSAFLIVVTNTAVTAPLSLSIQTACSQLAVSELTAEGTQRAL